jgi:inosine/xanthosine triphosphate pyrophosphatase family protein
MLPKIYLCSTNAKKISEFTKLIPTIIPLDRDLTERPIRLEEIQSFDPAKVVKHKLDQLLSYAYRGPAIYLVEDTSFFAHSLSGFPGPYIKDFFNVIGAHKFSELCKGDACIKTYIGALFINSECIVSHTKIYEGSQECTVHDAVKKFDDCSVLNDYDCIVSAKDSNVMFCEDQSTKLHRTRAIKSFHDDLIKENLI